MLWDLTQATNCVFQVIQQIEWSELSEKAWRVIKKGRCGLISLYSSSTENRSVKGRLRRKKSDEPHLTDENKEESNWKTQD